MNQEDKKPMEYGGITLKPGKFYQVIAPFRDYDSKLHAQGEQWEYLGCNIFPYDSGHTIYVRITNDEETVIRMQYHQDAQENILEHFSKYIKEA